MHSSGDFIAQAMRPNFGFCKQSFELQTLSSKCIVLHDAYQTMKAVLKHEYKANSTLIAQKLHDFTKLKLKASCMYEIKLQINIIHGYVYDITPKFNIHNKTHCQNYDSSHIYACMYELASNSSTFISILVFNHITFLNSHTW